MAEQELKEDILNILRVLSSNEGCNQRDLAGRLGFSLGKTNYLLKALVVKGLIKARNFTFKDQKMKKIQYVVTPKGIDARLKMTYHFLKRKEAEYLALKREIEGVKNA